MAPNEKPPVCRIMDYGKYKYEKKKKSHQHAHHTKTKEIRWARTGEHDVGFKVKQAYGFLEHKDKVQVSVIFRRREMAHIEEGRRVMESVIKEWRSSAKSRVRHSNTGNAWCVRLPPVGQRPRRGEAERSATER